MAGKPKIAELEARVGYAFRDRAPLYEALTHTSAGRTKDGGGSYQRLEFLGDRVLGMIVAETLFRDHPDAKEGDLSRRFSELVRKETCAEVAQRWDVAPHLVLGSGIPREATRANRNVLGDVCEAIIGAVFIDGGYEAARRVVLGGFGDFFSRARPVPRDPKTMLQEIVQGAGGPPPRYEVIETTGPAHAPVFRVAVTIEGGEAAEGVGPSKRAAEQEAARAALARAGQAREQDHE